MINRKILAAISILTVGAVVSACGQREVKYEVKNALVTSNESGDEAANKPQSGGMLSEKLGVIEKRWTEEAEGNGVSAKIKATVILPEASDMYVTTVKEHYADNADKERIIKALFDEGCVKVNVNKVPSRQWADNVYEYLTNYEEAYKNTDNNIAAYCLIERNNINEIYLDLPERDSLSEDIGDYSANHYIGTKDGISYTIDFLTDDKTDRSYWTYRAVNRNDFHENAQDVLSMMLDRYTVGNNECALTAQEAAAKAEEIAGSLGFDYMKTQMTTSLEFATHKNADSDYSTEYDGYYIVLARAIEDTLTDASIHYLNEQGKVDSVVIYDGAIKKPYDRERMEFELNDRGIMSITCSGWMDEIDAPKRAQLLDYKDIQQAFRDIIKENTKTSNITYEHLYLSYVKINDNGDEDVYRYVPAWRLNRYAWSETGTDSIMHNYWVSAIDGNRIFPEKTGDADVMNADNFLVELSFSEE